MEADFTPLIQPLLVQPFQLGGQYAIHQATSPSIFAFLAISFF
jgi:hypothetical protein